MRDPVSRLNRRTLLLCAAAPLVAEESSPPLPGEPSIERNLSPTSVDRFRIDLEQGAYFRIAIIRTTGDLRVKILGPNPDSNREVFVPQDVDAAEPLDIDATVAGTYRIDISPIEASRVKYRLRNARHLTPAARAESDRQEVLLRQSTVQWIRANARPIENIQSDSGFDDLRPLGRIIGKARVVAAGEATHGTRDFTECKVRLFKYLVTEKGFTALVVESTMSAAFEIDRYILTGEGQPETAVASGYWYMRTQEFTSLLRWMRGYNANPKNTRKLRYYGTDAELPFASSKLVEYLKRALPPDIVATPPASIQDAQRLVSILQEHRSDLIARTSSREWAIASYLSHHVLNQLTHDSIPDTDFWRQRFARDSRMADNTLRLLDQEGPAGKVMVWAHNGHVAAQAFFMGWHLRKKLGKDTVLLGFAFNAGSFLAKDIPVRGAVPPRRFTVGQAPPETFDALCASAGLRDAVVDLRHLPHSGPAVQWFAEPHTFRLIGSAAPKALETNSRINNHKHWIQRLYDAVIFFNQTQALRPLEPQK